MPTRATRFVVAVFLLLAAATSTSAQSPLSLADAIRRAHAQNPDAKAASSAEHEAEARVTQARGARLPRVDVAESWQRGNNPAFVFGSLLAQRQITAANFALDALNHPAAINNFGLSVS